MIRKRWWLNALLLFIILGLTSLAIWEPGLEKPEQFPPLINLKIEDVKTVNIERIGKETLTFNKQVTGEWQMTSPLDLSANTFRVKRLLTILGEQDYQVFPSEELSLADIQLDPPSVILTFDQQILKLGDISPLHPDRRYVQRGDQPQQVFLVKDSLYANLLEDAMAFVNLSILGDNPKIMSLQLPNYQLNLQDGNWKLLPDSAEHANISADILQELIDHWRYVQALSVESYQEGSAHQGQIVVTLQDGQVITLLIQAVHPELILARPEKKIQYHLPVEQVARLLELPPLKKEEKSVEKSESSAIEEAEIPAVTDPKPVEIPKVDDPKPPEIKSLELSPAPPVQTEN